MIIEIPTQEESQFQEIMSQYRKRRYRSPVWMCPKCEKVVYGRVYRCIYCDEQYDNSTSDVQ